MFPKKRSRSGSTLASPMPQKLKFSSQQNDVVWLKLRQMYPKKRCRSGTELASPVPQKLKFSSEKPKTSQNFKFYTKETNSVEPNNDDWLQHLRKDILKKTAIRKLQAFVRGKNARNIVTKNLALEERKIKVLYDTKKRIEIKKEILAQKNSEIKAQDAEIKELKELLASTRKELTEKCTKYETENRMLKTELRNKDIQIKINEEGEKIYIHHLTKELRKLKL